MISDRMKDEVKWQATEREEDVKKERKTINWKHVHWHEWVIKVFVIFFCCFGHILWRESNRRNVNWNLSKRKLGFLFDTTNTFYGLSFAKMKWFEWSWKPSKIQIDHLFVSGANVCFSLCSSKWVEFRVNAFQLPSDDELSGQWLNTREFHEIAIEKTQKKWNNSGGSIEYNGNDPL